MKNISFNDFITKAYGLENRNITVTCPSITFQVTDDCCLKCSYCYQINKGHRMMSKEVMKKGIDLLFKMYDENKPDSLINHNAKGIIIEFIGGEPFMNIDVISYGSEYFLNQCIERDHPWQYASRFSITTNGMLYFDPKVQEYLKKFRPFLSLNITIDGPKEMHDACRKDFEGNGSFDRVVAALADWHETEVIPETKVTISPENLPHLHTIIDFFIKYGCSIINANPIYEHEWTIDEAKLYYKQLKLVADDLIAHPHVETNLFGTMYGVPMLSTDIGNWCGGTGAMLAFDPDGNAYPCLRYMESSLGTTCKPIIIGTVDGIYVTKEEQEIYCNLNSVTRRTQSTDECFNCQVAGGCSWCSAWNYQSLGTVDKRSTNLCWMQRARSLVNSYFYNHRFIQQGREKRVPLYLERELALQIISNEEYDELLRLSLQ